MMEDNNKFYVYIYKDPDTLKPVYIGKGKNNRAYMHTSLAMKMAKDNRFYKYLRTLFSKNKSPIIEICSDNLLESDAFRIEEELVDLYGRLGIDSNGILLNLVPGGLYVPPLYKSGKSIFHKDLQDFLVKDGRHHWSGVKPWNNTSFNDAGRNTWKLADQIHKYCLDNPKHKRSIIFNKISKVDPDTNYSQNSIRNMIKHFNAGWTPLNDCDWIAFKSALQLSDKQIEIFDNTILKVKEIKVINVKPWNNSPTQKSTYTWKMADKIHRFYLDKPHYSPAKVVTELSEGDIKLSLGSVITLLKLFKKGWIPTKDPEWTKFKEL